MSDLVRLERALAAAMHGRDLAEERARLASDSIESLERRRGKEVADIDRELVETRARLELREEELKRTRAAAAEAAAAREVELKASDAELARQRAAAREAERRMQQSQAQAAQSQAQAERFKGALAELRGSRVYRLMRVLWRLRRPFGRARRDAVRVSADDDEPGPPAATPRASLPRSGNGLRVASILDEMSAACFAPECDLVPLSLEGWREQLDEAPPDLLLVESAWNGNGGEWQYRIASYPRPDLAGLPALRALIESCRERAIPTAFWNKEDPVHFERFAEAASLFDHVFTTDARCIERYRELPGGERTVVPLPFAAQPRIHNPAVAVPERSASPCFAGAWYRDRHPDRRRALAALLDAARPHGLVIYDRSFGGKDEAFGFPERFAPHILGKLPYERILDVYKSHGVFLNANSVADSPTMCSRRVFELAACDTAILSTPGVALEALLGEGVVAEAAEEEAAAAALERLLGDERERRRCARAARRRVFAEHTYAERLATIAETAGFDASSLRSEPFAPPRNGSSSENVAADSPDHPWLLSLRPGAELSEPALADLAAAARFAEADVIGAHPDGNGHAAIEHRLVAELDPRALLLRRELVGARGLPTGSAEQVEARLRQWSDDGVRLYAADAFLR